MKDCRAFGVRWSVSFSVLSYGFGVRQFLSVHGESFCFRGLNCCRAFR